MQDGIERRRGCRPLNGCFPLAISYSTTQTKIYPSADRVLRPAPARVTCTPPSPVLFRVNCASATIVDSDSPSSRSKFLRNGGFARPVENLYAHLGSRKDSSA
jgi:hypothetical protein